VSNNEKAFLEEYETLARKYDLIISGCGCCGSPYVIPVKDAAHIEDNITDLEESL